MLCLDTCDGLWMDACDGLMRTATAQLQLRPTSSLSEAELARAVVFRTQAVVRCAAGKPRNGTSQHFAHESVEECRSSVAARRWEAP
jgi:hypothetical protein